MPTPTLTGTPVASVYSNPISVTAGAGSNVIAIFGVRTLQASVPPAAVTATWGADAMTMLPQATNNIRTSTLGYRITPASGAQNVTATSTDSMRGFIGATFQDVTSLGTNGQNNGAGTTPTLTVGAISASDVFLVHLVWENAAVTLDTIGGTLIASTSEDNHRSAMVLVTSGTWSGTFSGTVSWAVSGVVLQGESGIPPRNQGNFTQGKPFTLNQSPSNGKLMRITNG
jgi:hypothetical protein